MSKEIGENLPSTLGHSIESFEIMGQERDGDARWVGAEMVVRVSTLGGYFLDVITKEHFASEKLKKALDVAADLEEMLTADDDAPQLPPPYVLNDEELTDEILHRKFLGRVIEADLAASLYKA